MACVTDCVWEIVPTLGPSNGQWDTVDNPYGTSSSSMMTKILLRRND